MKQIAQLVPSLILIYVGIGLLFGMYFFVKGAAQLDPLIKDSKWSVRLLLIPGAVGLWPLLLIRLIKKQKG